MAGTAKAHQIVPCMSAALRDGNDVVYLIHRSQPSFLQTHLSERMRRSIAVTDAFPGSAVLLIYVRTAFVFVVLPAGGCFVFLAILTVREVGTAGVGAWPLWFPWHRLTSLGHKKSPHRIAPMKAVFVLYFAIVMISQDGSAILCQTVPTFNPGQKNSGEPTRVCGVPCEATRSASGISPPRSSCPGNGNGVPAAPHGWQACRLPH